MISLTLGIVIIGAILVMYTSGSAATRSALAQGQMNEDGQMALAVITQELRQAGYNPSRVGGVKNDLGQGGWSIFACDSGFTAATLNNQLVSSLACNAGAATSTSLALVSEGDLVSGKNTTTAPIQPRDCIGNGVTAAAGGYYVMQSRLYISGTTLTCKGSGDLAQAQILAENIESMTISFAVAEPTVANSKVVLGYLSAAEIDTDPTLTAALPAKLDRWNKIVAARVCVIVVSETAELAQLQDKVGGSVSEYANCADGVTPYPDNKLRRAYRTTVLLRNHGVGYGS
jgi:type IV pilus assembly protein PilW